MHRRTFLQHSSLASAGFLVSRHGTGFAPDFPVVRIPEAQRKFKSPIIEKTIEDIHKNIGNREIAWLFENCFPNTLDTTVDFDLRNGNPDTYVITGDIDAMWLRDSSAQVFAYLPFCKEDKDLQLLLKGVIRRQAACILVDPYANAFYKDPTRVSEWKKTDLTDMKAGVHERKWELDSLCYPIRLSYFYWRTTQDTTVFDADWQSAMHLVLKTFKEQQRIDGEGPYHFERTTSWATDGVPMGGYGYPTKKVGMIHSMFRPSDDATVFALLVPSNCFAMVALNYLSEIAKDVLKDNEMYRKSQGLYYELEEAISNYGIVNHPQYGTIYVYETNGLGSHLLMDDANVPSLLSLSYLRFAGNTDPVYRNTRQFVLSEDNPFFFSGRAAQGIGGPHAGMDMIWPLSIIMRAITSIDDKEIRSCLNTLQKSHAGTGFMHESFNKDDPSRFTRKSFAWANTLFGELVLKIYREKKHLLD